MKLDETAAAAIVVIGGAGNFGRRIVANLARTFSDRLVVAGRNLARAEQAAERVGARAVRLDATSPRLAATLASLNPALVINASGPFQGQTPTVAEACVEVGANYVDLADDRNYVEGVVALDSQAMVQNVVLVTGASSVPGLSSTVIAALCKGTAPVSIEVAIVPGNRAERGLSTVTGILSTLGRIHKGWNDGISSPVRTWADVRCKPFSKGLGKRWLANVDVPDLTLLPRSYPTLRSVRFQAGLELGILHLATAAMAWCARNGLVADWSRWSRPIVRMSHGFDRFGTDVGGMEVIVETSTGHRTRWTLVANEGVGPFIPTIPAIIVANKIIRGQLSRPGAYPCLNLFCLDDFEREVAGMPITTEIDDLSDS